MTSHFDLSKYVGKRVMQSVQHTHLYTLASALDAILYNAVTSEGTDDKFTGGRVSFNNRQYLGEGGTKFLGREGAYFDALKLLREVQQELERLALLEATS